LNLVLFPLRYLVITELKQGRVVMACPGDRQIRKTVCHASLPLKLANYCNRSAYSIVTYIIGRAIIINSRFN
jgi:hypothetical protein